MLVTQLKNIYCPSARPPIGKKSSYYPYDLHPPPIQVPEEGVRVRGEREGPRRGLPGDRGGGEPPRCRVLSQRGLQEDSLRHQPFYRNRVPRRPCGLREEPVLQLHGVCVVDGKDFGVWGLGRVFGRRGGVFLLRGRGNFLLF